MKLNSTIIVHQAYRVFAPFNGMQTYRIAFLCATRGLVEIFREIPIAENEWDQAALVREAIAQFRNS